MESQINRPTLLIVAIILRLIALIAAPVNVLVRRLRESLLWTRIVELRR